MDLDWVPCSSIAKTGCHNTQASAGARNLLCIVCAEPVSTITSWLHQTSVLSQHVVCVCGFQQKCTIFRLMTNFLLNMIVMFIYCGNFWSNVKWLWPSPKPWYWCLTTMTLHSMWLTRNQYCLFKFSSPGFEQYNYTHQPLSLHEPILPRLVHV